MTIAVFGPDIHNHISGYGWVKFNIIKGLIHAGYDVVSVYHKYKNEKQNSLIQVGKSSEERGNDNLDIKYISITDAQSWENVVSTMQFTGIITVGDPDKSWFIPLVKELQNVPKIYYYISEGITANRYIPTNENTFLDITKVLSYYDLIIPATDITIKSLKNDLGIVNNVLSFSITNPVWKWDINRHKEYEYREKYNIKLDSNLFFCIANNNERKRLDQLLIYFKSSLARKSCCRLVIHTNVHSNNGYELEAIAYRLGISDKIILVPDMNKKAIEGIFSSGKVFINMPAAEGYGLPFYEALKLGKKCIHSDIGQIALDSRNLKKSNIELVEAKHRYFYKVGNQVWHAIGDQPITRQFGNNGNYTIDEITNTPREFQQLITEQYEKIKRKKNG